MVFVCLFLGHVIHVGFDVLLVGWLFWHLFLRKRNHVVPLNFQEASEPGSIWMVFGETCVGLGSWA